MTEEELQNYALKGMRTDVAERAAEVRQGMARMKERLDTEGRNMFVRQRHKGAIDALMAALVAFDEAMEKAERYSRSTYSKGGADNGRSNDRVRPTAG